MEDYIFEPGDRFTLEPEDRFIEVFSGRDTGDDIYRRYIPALAKEPSDLWGPHLDDPSIRKFSRYASAPDPSALFEDFEEDDSHMVWGRTIEYMDKYKDEHVTLNCNDESDLTQDRILKTLSIMKSKMMMKCVPYKLDRIECKMTPAVRHNIISSCKRLEMYGKKIPFVACFDEYGRRLDDHVKLDTLRGMLIKIVDPMQYGNLYLEFEGVIRDIDEKRQQSH